MIYEVMLAGDASFEDWRTRARVALALDVAPEDIRFSVSDGDSLDLFRVRPLPAEAPSDRRLTIPVRFKRAAADAALHGDSGRFQFLYGLVWRLRDEPHLMEIATDPDVLKLQKMAQSVGRDLYKMKAFVRFRRLPDDADQRYVAWFEPAHHVTARAAEFFIRRFAGMTWSLFTPDKSAHWDQQALTFDKGVSHSDWMSIKDGNEDLWKIYFANIFNPARLKTKAMRAQMPKKYWKNLPEASLIPHLVKAAGARADQMVTAPPTTPPVRHVLLAAGREKPPDSSVTGAEPPPP